ncbi:MAG: transcription elongation factor GreA [Candidatus Saccharimonadales bacterium]|nr:transcription elongation factor GreA [Candidatus Saccharimonadales bacterium]
MVKKEFQLTKSGIKELEAEHKELTGKRKEIAEKLKTARDLGDLKENTEYHNARDEQVNLETRISEIEHILQNAEVITNGRDNSKIDLGDTVELKGNGMNPTLMIVGSFEANPAENKISNESPIGKQLLGKSVGDKIKVEKPGGNTIYTIKKIS